MCNERHEKPVKVHRSKDDSFDFMTLEELYRQCVDKHYQLKRGGQPSDILQDLNAALPEECYLRLENLMDDTHVDFINGCIAEGLSPFEVQMRVYESRKLKAPGACYWPDCVS